MRILSMGLLLPLLLSVWGLQARVTNLLTDRELLESLVGREYLQDILGVKNDSKEEFIKEAQQKSLTPLIFDGQHDPLELSGFSSGGGGNAFVCHNKQGQISEVGLLDYFEGLRKDRAQEKSIALAGSTVAAKIKSAFKRMEKIDLDLANRLRNRALWIANRIDYFLLPAKEGKLTPLYDMHLPFVPNENKRGDKCLIVRFAVQEKNPAAGQKKFYFVKELYAHENTSLTTRAGIIIHEVFYEEAIKFGAPDSDFVRWLTYLISSLTLENFSDADYDDLKKSPGAEFLQGPGDQSKLEKVSTESLLAPGPSARDNVFVLDIYPLNILGQKISCYQIGLCQLFTGEYIGRSETSSHLFPQFDIMLKDFTMNIPDASKESGVRGIKKVRGESWTGFSSLVALTNENRHHSAGRRIGDLVGVRYDTTLGIISYTGIIVGIFGDGNLALKLIDGRFEINGVDVNPFILNPKDSDITLFSTIENATTGTP